MCLICNIYLSLYITNETLITFLSTPLTTINKGILVNETPFIIKINTANHFLKNWAQIKWDTCNIRRTYTLKLHGGRGLDNNATYAMIKSGIYHEPFNSDKWRNQIHNTVCKFCKRKTNASLEVKIGEYNIPQHYGLRTLGQIVQMDREIEGDVNHRI